MITHIGLDIGTSKVAVAYYNQEEQGDIQMFALGEHLTASTSTYIQLDAGQVLLGFPRQQREGHLYLEPEKHFLGLFSPRTREAYRRAEWERVQELKNIQRVHLIRENRDQVAFYTAKDRGPEHPMQLRPYRILAIRLLGIWQQLAKNERKEASLQNTNPNNLLPQLKYIGIALPAQAEASVREDMLNAVRLSLVMLWGSFLLQKQTRHALQMCVEENEGAGQEITRLLRKVMASTADIQKDVRSLGQRVDQVKIRVLDEPTAALCSYLYDTAEHSRTQLNLPTSAQSQRKGRSHVVVMDGGAGSTDLTLVRLHFQVVGGDGGRFEEPQVELHFQPIDDNKSLDMPGMFFLDRIFAERCFRHGPPGLPFWLVEKTNDSYTRRLFSDIYSRERMDKLLHNNLDRWLVSILQSDGAAGGFWGPLVRNTLCNLQQGGDHREWSEVYHWLSSGTTFPAQDPLLWEQHESRVTFLSARGIEQDVQQWGWMTQGNLARRLLSLLYRWAEDVYLNDPELGRAREDFLTAMAQWIAQVRFSIANIKPESAAKSGSYFDPDTDTWILGSNKPPPVQEKRLKPPLFETSRFRLEFQELDEDTLVEVCHTEVELMESSCEIKRFEFDQFGHEAQYPILITGGLRYYPPIWEKLARPFLRNAAGEEAPPVVRNDNSKPELDVAVGCCWAGCDFGEGYIPRFSYHPQFNLRFAIHAPTIDPNPAFQTRDPRGQRESPLQANVFHVFSENEMQPERSRASLIPVGVSQPQRGYCQIPYRKGHSDLFDSSGTPVGFEGYEPMKKDGFPHFLVEGWTLSGEKVFHKWIQIELPYFQYISVQRRIESDLSIALVFTPHADEGYAKIEAEKQATIHLEPYMATQGLIRVAAQLLWGKPLDGQAYSFHQAQFAPQEDGRGVLIEQELTWFS